jgi:hypothetical protein
MEEAEVLARNARNPEAKEQKSSAGNRTKASGGNRTINAQLHGAETITTAMVRKPPLLSISPGEAPVRREWSTPTLTEMTANEAEQFLCTAFPADCTINLEYLANLHAQNIGRKISH